MLQEKQISRTSKVRAEAAGRKNFATFGDLTDVS
jgi:hypothetical protein